MTATLRRNDIDLGSELVTDAARLVREVRRRYDLPATTRVLSILDQRGPLGITQLAQADRCSQPTMSAAVARLGADGLVAKRPHPSDSRAWLVTLTPRGAEELDRVRRHYGEAVAAEVAAHPDLSSADLHTAVRVLHALLTSEALGEKDL